MRHRIWALAVAAGIAGAASSVSCEERRAHSPSVGTPATQPSHAPASKPQSPATKPEPPATTRQSPATAPHAATKPSTTTQAAREAARDLADLLALWRELEY